MKTIEERITEIKNELGKDIFTHQGGKYQYTLIGNGERFFAFDDSKFNGEYYTAFEVDGISCYSNQKNPNYVEICEIVLETEEDCYESIGYTFGTRTITYTMDGILDC